MVYPPFFQTLKNNEVKMMRTLFEQTEKQRINVRNIPNSRYTTNALRVSYPRFCDCGSPTPINSALHCRNCEQAFAQVLREREFEAEFKSETLKLAIFIIALVVVIALAVWTIKNLF